MFFRQIPRFIADLRLTSKFHAKIDGVLLYEFIVFMFLTEGPLIALSNCRFITSGSNIMSLLSQMDHKMAQSPTNTFFGQYFKNITFENTKE